MAFSNHASHLSCALADLSDNDQPTPASPVDLSTLCSISEELEQATCNLPAVLVVPACSCPTSAATIAAPASVASNILTPYS
jgi:hypothetical protein